MQIITSLPQYMDEHGTSKGYYAQFPNTPTTINVDDEFVVMPNTWQESTKKVLYIDEKIILTEEIKGLTKGSRSMYYSKGDMIGWRYNDVRPSYRLQVQLNKGKK